MPSSPGALRLPNACEEVPRAAIQKSSLAVGVREVTPVVPSPLAKKELAN